MVAQHPSSDDLANFESLAANFYGSQGNVAQPLSFGLLSKKAQWSHGRLWPLGNFLRTFYSFDKVLFFWVFFCVNLFVAHLAEYKYVIFESLETVLVQNFCRNNFWLESRIIATNMGCKLANQQNSVKSQTIYRICYRTYKIYIFYSAYNVTQKVKLKMLLPTVPFLDDGN
jgi:hypothetical protein